MCECVCAYVCVPLVVDVDIYELQFHTSYLIAFISKEIVMDVVFIR